jgi:hypothetical protein
MYFVLDIPLSSVLCIGLLRFVTKVTQSCDQIPYLYKSFPLGLRRQLICHDNNREVCLTSVIANKMSFHKKKKTKKHNEKLTKTTHLQNLECIAQNT